MRYFYKKKKRHINDYFPYLFSIIGILLMSYIVFFYDSSLFTGLATFSIGNQNEFDQGNYTNTQWNVDHVKLTSGNTNGTYISKVYDVNRTSIWNNISWTENISSQNFRIIAADISADVWKSTDNGVTWTLIKDDYNGGEGNNVDDSVIDSNNKLYIVDGQDIWRSDDSGYGWTKVNDNYNGAEGQDAKVMVADKTSYIYIFEGDDDVWRSSDQGLNWTKTATNFNGGNGNVRGAVVGSTNIIFVVDGAADVWKSNDQGSNWTLVKDDYNGGEGNDAEDMAIDSNNIFYIAHAQDIWNSSDLGLTWTKVNDDYNGGEAQDARVLLVDNNNNVFLIEGDEDVWKSTNNGLNWNKIATNMNGGNGNVRGAFLFTFSNDLTFSVRSCNLSDCSDSSFSGNYTNYVNETLIISNSRYFQYKATLTTQDNSVSPSLSSFLVDYSPILEPTINLNSPSNGTEFNNTNNITFSYLVSSLANVSSCSLILNNAINDTDNSIIKDINLTFNKTLTNGNYNWNINCTDQYNQVNSSAIRNLVVNLDSIAPNVSVILPSGNNSISQNSIVTFRVNAVDNNAISLVRANVTLPNNDLNIVNLINTNNNIFEYNFSNTSEKGTYNILYFVNDTSDNINATATDSFIVIASSTPPPDNPSNNDDNTRGGGGSLGNSEENTSTENNPNNNELQSIIPNNILPSGDNSGIVNNPTFEREQTGGLLTGFVTFGAQLGEFSLNNIFSLFLLGLTITYISIRVINLFGLSVLNKTRKVKKRKRR